LVEARFKVRTAFVTLEPGGMAEARSNSMRARRMEPVEELFRPAKMDDPEPLARAPERFSIRVLSF
jgi:hypothetical protein